MNNWQESQIQALIAAGVDAVDAQASVAFVAEFMPQDAAPATFLLCENVDYFGYPAYPTPEHIQDARIAWFADDSVSPKWKRILDAEDMP